MNVKPSYIDLEQRIKDLEEQLGIQKEYIARSHSTSPLKKSNTNNARNTLIEEKEKLLSKIRQTQKMEAIGSLASGIAHDFNNILAAILGYAEMAMADIPDSHPAGQCIEEVLMAGRRARELVKQILTFSRQNDEFQIPIRITSLTKEALKLLRASLPSTIEIRANTASDCGTIHADPTQIHQVLMNLCTNAAQAMEDTGGVLEIHMENVDYDEEIHIGLKAIPPGSYVMLTVKDSGPGIEPCHINHIFEPYFTTKDANKGSGMGLAVVQGIIERHQAHITVERPMDGGTSFILFFPRIDEQELMDSRDTVSLPTGIEKILVVDDEETIAEMVGFVLNQLGYKVVKETDSIEALEFFSSEPDCFDLVITDQTMPKLTGSQITKEMLAIRPDLPVIITTGYGSRIDHEHAIDAGAKDFILKPFERWELAQIVRKTLDTS